MSHGRFFGLKSISNVVEPGCTLASGMPPCWGPCEAGLACVLLLASFGLSKLEELRSRLDLDPTAHKECYVRHSTLVKDRSSKGCSKAAIPSSVSPRLSELSAELALKVSNHSSSNEVPFQVHQQKQSHHLSGQWPCAGKQEVYIAQNLDLG